MQLDQARRDFRIEKESILERAHKQQSKLEDKVREMQIMTDKQMEDLRSQTTYKRLKVEKRYEERQERLEKEKDELTAKVSDLTDSLARDTT